MKKIKIAFIMYCIAVFDVFVLKFFGNFQMVVERVNRTVNLKKEYGYINAELQPFRSIKIAINSIQKFGFDILYPPILNFIINIIAFIPLGIFFTILLKKANIMKILVLSLLFVMFIEVTQFVTCLGIFDVDDIILNTLGCFIGYTISKFYNAVFK